MRPCRYGFVAVTIDARVRTRNGSSQSRNRTSRSAMVARGSDASPAGGQKSTSIRWWRGVRLVDRERRRESARSTAARSSHRSRCTRVRGTGWCRCAGRPGRSGPCRDRRSAVGHTAAAVRNTRPSGSKTTLPSPRIKPATARSSRRLMPRRDAPRASQPSPRRPRGQCASARALRSSCSSGREAPGVSPVTLSWNQTGPRWPITVAAPPPASGRTIQTPSDAPPPATRTCPAPVAVSRTSSTRVIRSAQAAARTVRLNTITSSCARTGLDPGAAPGRSSSIMAASRTPLMLRWTEAGGPRIGRTVRASY